MPVRVIAELLAFLSLVIATALLLRPLQENLLRRMVELRDSAIARAERVIGHQIEYRSMGPSLFGTIDLRGIRIVGVDGLPLVSVTRFRIGYSLVDLLRGNAAASIKSISLDRPIISISTERDEDLISLAVDLMNNRTAGDPAERQSALRIRVRGGMLSWNDGSSAVALSGVSLSAALKDAHLLFDAGASMEADLSGGFGALGKIKTALKAKGDLVADLRSGNFTISVPRFDTEVVDFRPQTMLIVFTENRFEFRKIKDRSPFDLSGRYDPATGSLEAEVLMEDFSPRRIMSFRGELSRYDDWLEAMGSGKISLSLARDGTSAYAFDLSGRLPPSNPLGAAEAVVKGSGTQAAVEIDAAAIRSPRGEAQFSGSVAFAPLRPEGQLRLSGVELRNGKRLDADLLIIFEGMDATVFADRFDIDGVSFSAVDGRIHPEGESYTFSLSALRFSETEAYEDVRLARLSAEGSFSTNDPFLQLSVSLEAFSAGEAIEVGTAFARLPSIADARLLDDISVTTEIFITTDFTHLSYNAPRLVVAYRGGADVFAVASLSGTDTRLDLQDARVIWKGGSLSGGASVDFHDSDDIAFALRTEWQGIAYAFNGVILDGHTVSLQGDYGLSATVVIAESGHLSGVVSARGVPFALGARPFSATLGAAFRWEGIDAWAIDLDELRVEEGGASDSVGLRIAARGALDHKGAVIPRLSIDNGQGSLNGNARFSWAAGFRSLKGSARLSDDLGQERYEIEGERSEDGYAARLYLSKGRLMRFIADSSEAVATGELRLRWAGSLDYEASWRISDLRMKVQGEELHASLSGTLSPDILDLEDASFAYSGFAAVFESLRIDRQDRTAEGAFRIRGSAAGRDTDVVARSRISFAPMADWRALREAAVTVEGSLDITRARFGTLEAASPFRFSLTKDADRFSVEGGPNDSIRFRADGAGAFYATFSAPSPFRGTFIGSIANGRIDASANNYYLDFQALWRLLPFRDIVNFTGGFANGSLTIRGPIGDPEFIGSARATGIRLSIPSWIDGTAGPAAVDVSFTGDSFSFGPVTVPAAEGQGTVAAKFSFDRWIPSSFDLSIDVPRTAPVKAKSGVAGVVANGTASGNFRINRQNGEIEVTGALTAESATIMMDPERYSVGRAEAAALAPYPVRVSLGLRTGRKVEFSWPSTELPVLRVTANADDSLAIMYDGLSGRFGLKGSVFLRGGEVFYFQRSFYVREGLIRFNESEVRMDPSLSIRAEIRDRYQEGPVTIALIVDESPLSSFLPRLESDPALSQMEIFSLLGQNLVEVDSQTGSASMQDSLLLASSDLLAQFNVIRRFEQKARDLLGLDMFSVRTQVLQNAVLDAAGLRSVPVDRIGGLGNYFDNTTVYLGKYIGSDLFLQAMFSMQYDETKAGNVFGGLKLEPDIGIELKTPLFLVRWSFLPEHPENIFVDDQAFTLTWKKSF